MNRWSTLLILCGFASAASAGQAVLATGGDVRVVPMSDVKASLVRAGRAARVEFSKAGDVRRMLALEAKPRGRLPGAKALEVEYALQMRSGAAPRPAVVIYERGGGAWFKVSGRPLRGAEPDQPRRTRLPLAALRQAAFSRDASGRLEWSQVEKVWIGFIMDEPAQGRLTFLRAALTDEPYRPTEPLEITSAARPGQWSVGHHPAVKAAVTTPREGPDGQPCMKVSFTMPGGAHMWMTPVVALPNDETEGYRALKFTYKAALPPGLKGLLVTLTEGGGGQYYADPPPPASAQWRTIVLPWSSFKKASWTRDANNRFDLADLRKVCIGTHGVAKPNHSQWTIWVANVQLVP